MQRYRQILIFLVLLALLTSLLTVPFLLPATQAEPYQQLSPVEQTLAGTTIRFATSNREADPFDRSDAGASRLASLLGRSGAMIEALNWEVPIPDDTDLIVLVGPSQSYQGYQVARLWAYLQEGGKLLILSDPPPVSGNSLRQESGIFELLWIDFGIRGLDYGLVNPADDTPPPAPAEIANEEGTPFPTPTAVPAEFPPQQFADLRADSANHPILNGVTVENLTLNLGRPLEMEAYTENSVVEPLLYTSDRVYGEADAQSVAAFGVYHYDSEFDSSQQPYLVLAASEHRGTGGRVVVIGDADWGRNGFGFSTSPPGSDAMVFPDTVQLVINAVHWLLGIESQTFEFAEAMPTATPTQIPSPTPSPDEAGDDN